MKQNHSASALTSSFRLHPSSFILPRKEGALAANGSGPQRSRASVQEKPFLSPPSILILYRGNKQCQQEKWEIQSIGPEDRPATYRLRPHLPNVYNVPSAAQDCWRKNPKILAALTPPSAPTSSAAAAVRHEQGGLAHQVRPYPRRRPH